jgi:iron complex outermembrane receptor protein
MKTKTLFAVILVMAAAMTVAPEVWAKDVQAQAEQNEFTLEEITVTATKRETALEDTPLAISVVTGDQMNEQGQNDIFDILKDVPGLTFGTEFSGVAPHLNIRGISGGILGPEQHGDPAVAMNVDGAYSSPLLGSPLDVSFYDIARVELLRGPQGTLYGRNSEGGVLNVITNDPTDKQEGSGSIELGDFNLIRGTAMVNTPLTDNSAIRLAFQYYERDSYYATGGAGNTTSGRLKYLYKPSDALRLVIGGEITMERNAGVGTVEPWGLGDYPTGDPYDNLTRTFGQGLAGELPEFDPAYRRSEKPRSSKVWAQVDWETPLGTVTFLPSYYKRKLQSASYSQLTYSIPYTYSIGKNTEDANQKSFEARLASKGDSAFDYVLGIFYLDAKEVTIAENLQASSHTYSSNGVGQTSKAVFGQGTYHFTDRFRGSLGLRYTRDTKNFDTSDTFFGLGGENIAEKKWTRMDYKVGVEMDIFEDGLLYADVATGYRPGSANIKASATTLDAAGNVIAYPNMFTEPEKLLAYEMGAKTSFFNKRLTVDVDAYYYDYTNRQYTEILPEVPLDQPCPATGVKPADALTNNPLTGLCYAERNMGKVTTYGAELSTAMRPTDNDTVNLSVAYLKAYVAESQRILVGLAFGPGGVAGVYADANGATMPSSPKLGVNLGYEHRFDFKPGSLLLRGDGRYESKSYVQDFNYLNPGTSTFKYLDGVSRTYSFRDLYTSEAHMTFDFTATYMMSEGKYTISAYVKNITDEYWKMRTDGTAMAAISGIRTYGATFTLRF